MSIRRFTDIVLRKRKSQSRHEAEPIYTDCSDDDEAAQWSSLRSESLILVMGVTGAGKSYFINKLKPGSVAEGDGLGSQTKKCELVQMQIGTCTVAAVDTPGFDDDADSDAEVLAKISRFLATQRGLDIKLKGIILLHRITDPRFSGSSQRFLDTFRRVCGEEAYKNVALVTTMWGNEDHGKKLKLEAELQVKYWSDLKAKGADVFRYNGSSGMAETIVGLLLMKDDVVLQLQRELAEAAHLKDTTAGAVLASELDRSLTASEGQIVSLERRLREAQIAKDKTKVRQLEEDLRKEKARNLRQKTSREALRPRIAQETDKEIKKVTKEKKSKGEKWKSRLQIFAMVLGPMLSIGTAFIS